MQRKRNRLLSVLRSHPGGEKTLVPSPGEPEERPGPSGTGEVVTFSTVHPTGQRGGLRRKWAFKVIAYDLLLPVVPSLCKLLLLSVGWTGESLLAKTIGRRGWDVTSGIRSLETDFCDTWARPLSSPHLLTCQNPTAVLGAAGRSDCLRSGKWRGRPPPNSQ